MMTSLAACIWMGAYDSDAFACRCVCAALERYIHMNICGGWRMAGFTYLRNLRNCSPAGARIIRSPRDMISPAATARGRSASKPPSFSMMSTDS